MIIGSEVGKRFDGVSLGTCIVDDMNKTAIEYAKEFVSVGSSGLILTGKVGTGKTYIMMAILNDITGSADYGSESIVYWKSWDLANAIRNNIEINSTAIIDSAKNADIMFIDDLGLEYHKNGSDFIKTTFRSIFDYRWENKLPIVFTTSIYSIELVRLYGADVISRWCDSCDIVELRGDDRRDGGS